MGVKKRGLTALSIGLALVVAGVAFIIAAAFFGTIVFGTG